MGLQQHSGKSVQHLDWHPVSVSRGPDITGGGIDWPNWLRGIDRKRRLLLQLPGFSSRSLPSVYFSQATYSSFRLDGIDTSEREVVAALTAGPGQNSLRSRSAQRIRNHVSLLHRIETSVRLGESLKVSAVLRWYTTVGCGLISAGLSDGVMNRMDQVVRRINSPQLRLQPALSDIARLHVQLLHDPLVPSFNGILARLLLRHHLGRIGLPPVVFDPENDAPRLMAENMLLGRLLELIDYSYQLLLKVDAGAGDGGR